MYTDLLRRTTSALPQNTAETRLAVYSRAREALDLHLSKNDLEIDDAAKEGLRSQLEQEIVAFEAEQVAATPIAEKTSVSEVPSDMPDLERILPGIQTETAVERSSAVPLAAAAVVAILLLGGATAWWLVSPSGTAVPPSVQEVAPTDVDEAPAVEADAPTVPETVSIPESVATSAVEPSVVPAEQDDPIASSTDTVDTTTPSTENAVVDEDIAQATEPQVVGTSEEIEPAGSDSIDPTTVPSTAPVVVAETPVLSMPPREAVLLRTGGAGGSALQANGTISWTEAVDAEGSDIVVGEASFPDVGFDATLRIVPNRDAGMSASHLIEIEIRSPRGMVVAELDAVLLKDVGLSIGEPIRGAVAKVSDGLFIFAVDAAMDTAAQDDLLSERRWIDLALTTSDGRPVVLSLSKSDQDDAMFGEVFSSWR